MSTVYIIIHPNPHSDSDAELPRFTSPEQEAVDTVVHIMTRNATPKPETGTAFPSKLSRSLTAAAVLVTAPVPSIPGAIDGIQETPDIPVVRHKEEARTVGLTPPGTKPSEAPTAKVSKQVVESSEIETSPVVADIEESSHPNEPLGGSYSQKKSAALPITEDIHTRTTLLSAIVPSSAAKPYQTGIQVPSQSRVADGFPYPPGLAAYEILEEDWNKFTAHLASLISPQRNKKKKKTPIRLVLTFGGRGAKSEKLDFQKSHSKVFEYVRASQNNLFRPKGLLVRVDIPEEGVGMEFMDLYHGGHVDHLSDTWGLEARVANAGPVADGEGIDATAEEVAAHSKVSRTALQPNKAQTKANKAQDTTLEKARKQQLKALGHLNSARKKMSQRIRIVIEPVTVLGNVERSEKNGWIAWIRHCDNYGSQLTN
ncbi:hypothetical protein VC83_07096 [Pseudogymnoascus destructans]|uniref:Uncharacterized protein n=1 Tax=Pseudogymnoascus destructans TaxID=655981 RepID=A0A177A5Z5_9PEZI|nr:uncharacterized protein VC83_07096 [Pseudogymnoascus destructans]OAF56892.2 hypothetical protein VC83_07096 [Pseudogymnoascus destructans]